MSGRSVPLPTKGKDLDHVTQIADCHRHQTLAGFGGAGTGEEKPGHGRDGRHIQSDHYLRHHQRRAFRSNITELAEQGDDDDTIAWKLDDQLVRQAQDVFLPVWEQTKGNDGYVSFELDPLLEDVADPTPHAKAVARYIELGKRWSAGHKNRMIKVPATAGRARCAGGAGGRGITLNVTLIFSERQYKLARDAVWRGAQRRKSGLDGFKSVYSIFVSRVDVYTEKHVPDLSPAAQGLVGIVNVKRLWRLNQEFWKDKDLQLQQEIVFASTGTKKPTDPARQVR